MVGRRLVPTAGAGGRPVASLAIAAALLCLAAAACTEPFIPSGGGGAPPPGTGSNSSLFTYRAVFAGGVSHACVLANGGRALCWGSNRQGQLGDGSTEDSDEPRFVGGAHAFETLAILGHSCGLTTNDVAFCWGANVRGRLGDGTTRNRSLPTRVDTELRFVEIGAGGVFSCARTADGEVYCWGANPSGQLGTHPDTIGLRPVRLETDHRFATISVGVGHACGLDADGLLLCWGGPWGAEPTPLSGAPRFSSVSVGGDHLCGLDAGGRAHCWGENEHGQLGDGTTTGRSFGEPPVAVATELRFERISVGARHTCAVDVEGVGWCWGDDRAGQLGNGDPAGGVPEERSLPPVRVALFTPLAWISAGGTRSCAVNDRAEAFCWGFGTGNATRPTSSRPVQLPS